MAPHTQLPGCSATLTPFKGWIYLYPDQILLLQIDSEDDAGMMWGDVGRLYWWMKKDELTRRDFTQMRFDEQSS